MDRRWHDGVSLIELLVATSVLSTLLALGWPSFAEALTRQRVRTAAHLLGGHFASARNTAISRHMAVTVCPSSNGRHCSPGNDWSQGWLIYHEAATDGAATAGNTPLQYGRPAAGNRLRLLASAGRSQLRFLADGRSAGSNLSVAICDGKWLRAEVVVNNLGRIRSQRFDSSQACPDASATAAAASPTIIQSGLTYAMATVSPEPP